MLFAALIVLVVWLIISIPASFALFTEAFSGAFGHSRMSPAGFGLLIVAAFPAMAIAWIIEKVRK